MLARRVRMKNEVSRFRAEPSREFAKEGRKFGLSLVVASQRPSEVSPTIISQCANFFSHRLQNPDDIDHLRRIIPKQAQRLLDQVTVLTAGEAIAFGSALQILPAFRLIPRARNRGVQQQLHMPSGRKNRVFRWMRFAGMGRCAVGR